MADEPPFPARLTETPDAAPHLKRRLQHVQEADMSHGAIVHRVGTRLARGEGLDRSAPTRRRRLVPWLAWGSLALVGSAVAWWGIQEGRERRAGKAGAELQLEGGGVRRGPAVPRLTSGGWSSSSSGDESSLTPSEQIVDAQTPAVIASAPDSRPDGLRAASACGPFVPGNALALCAGTYLSGPGADVPTAVQIAADRTVVWAGTLDGVPAGAPARTLISPGAGAVMRLGAQGREVLSVTRLGERIVDLELDAQDRIVALGAPFGVVVLDATAERILWQRPVQGDRLALAADGTLAVLEGQHQQVSLLDREGNTAAVFGLALPRPGTPSDVAIDSASRLVFVTGSLDGTPPQPFLRAYGYDGSLRWQNWGAGEDEARARSLNAATRGERILMGRDGRLYYAGYSIGSNSVHLRDPRDLHKRLATVMIDRYTDPAHVANYAVLFVARLSPEDGAVEAAQFHQTRNDKDKGGKGRSMKPGALAVDEAGRVMIGGYQICCMEGQMEKSVAGLSVAQSGGRDAFVLVLSPDLRHRLLWTTFGPSSAATGVAMRGGVATMTATVVRSVTTGPMALHEPLQSRLQGGADAYLAVWPAP